MEAVTFGGALVQPPLSDAETNEVLATVKSFHTFAGLKIYDNFRCNARILMMIPAGTSLAANT
jgi:hypothetical protein